jgi:hypothetical protein
MIADLDTFLTAPYVELTDRISPARGFTRRGAGQRPEATDAESAIAMAQVLLRFDDALVDTSSPSWMRPSKMCSAPM